MTIERGEAEAIQINGAAGGGVVRRQWREERRGEERRGEERRGEERNVRGGVGGGGGGGGEERKGAEG